MKLAIVNLGQIVSGNWRDPFAAGDAILTDGDHITRVGTASAAEVEGADAVIDPTQVDPVKQILADTGQRGVDVSIDCASKDETWNQSLLATRNAGRVVITGIPSEEFPPLAFHVLRRKEITFYTVRRSNRESETALRLLSDQPKRFMPVLTHSQSICEIQPVFERCADYEPGIGKFVLTL